MPLAYYSWVSYENVNCNGISNGPYIMCMQLPMGQVIVMVCLRLSYHYNITDCLIMSYEFWQVCIHCLAFASRPFLHYPLTMAPQWKSCVQYNYSEGTLNNQIPCPTCSKMFKWQGFKKHETSHNIQRKQEMESAQAGHHYEWELKGTYWSCFIVLVHTICISCF